MTSLHVLFGQNGLFVNSDHRNCHAVIDGSNVLHRLGQKSWLSDFGQYADNVRRFFRWLQKANIVPHVLFDGPNFGDTAKLSRTRRRRDQRLSSLLELHRGNRAENYPYTAIQDVFRDVASEMGVETLQVIGDRDFTIEIVAYAKYLNALVISGNTKFFLQDIPRGCLLLRDELEMDPSKPVVGPTILYRNFANRIRLEYSKDRYAPQVWFAITQAQGLGCEFFEPFKKLFYRPNQTSFRYVPSRHMCLLSVPPGKFYTRVSVQILDFLCQHTADEADNIITKELLPQQRKEARLVLQQARASFNVPGANVLERVQASINSNRYLTREYPQWFLQDISVKSKLLSGLLDTAVSRLHYMSVLTEDPDKESCHVVSLRLRRILYAILLRLPGEAFEEESHIVQEIDRVGHILEDIPVSSLCQLWDPEDRSEPLEVPTLPEVELWSKEQRAACFLLSLTVRKSLFTKLRSRRLFLVCILKYWVHCAEVSRHDLINVLLSILIVERKYSTASGLFVKPVSLRHNVDPRLYNDEGLVVMPRLDRMHVFAQLESTITFATNVHRLLQQPLGETADFITWHFSESVFHHLAGRTDSLLRAGRSVEAAGALNQLLDELMDKTNRAAFQETVNLIWNAEDIQSAKWMLEQDSVNFEG